MTATSGHCLLIVPKTYYVSGSNDPNVNGSYTIAATNFEGKFRWVKGDLELRWNDSVMGYSWVIENDSTLNVYYAQFDNTTLPGQVYWNCFAALSPCTPPVVTSYKIPDQLTVSGTVDSFLNDIYTRGLNHNGFVKYAKNNYEIRSGHYIMAGSWVIVRNPGAGDDIFYHNNAGSVSVPEQGWYMGAYAGTPVSPPVVTDFTLEPKYKVQGAGSSAANGVYTRVLNDSSGPVYDKGDGYTLRTGYFYSMEFCYGIRNESTGTYYWVDNNSRSLSVPKTEWALSTFGVNPPPTVVPYFPWSLFMPSVKGEQE